METPFTIPVNKKRKWHEPVPLDDSQLTQQDYERIKKVPVVLCEMVKHRIIMANVTTEHHIRLIREKHGNMLDTYMATVVETYNHMMDAIEHCTGELLIVIKGVRSHSYEPTLQRWMIDNLGHADAIKYVMDELVTKGWKPLIKLDNFSKDPDDFSITGGDSVTMRCNFKY